MPATAIQPRTTKLALKPGENQVSFIERGDRELYQRIPDTTQRSRHLLQMWREAGGDRELAQITSERFPAQEFHTVHDSPLFAEHVTTDNDGNRVKYGRSELASIVRSCNERILDTGDFAVLSAGHTPDAESMATGAKMPDVLGYVGPFRLGKIGNRRPRWAIFADEHYHRSDLEKVRRLPRRSSELFLEDMILDPVAALGAETPRLDTGIVRNCRNSNGQTVRKYSAMAYPAAGSTSPQSFRSDKKTTYAAGDSPMDDPQKKPDELGNDAISTLDTLGDEQLSKIIQGVAAAVMQSKSMQYLISTMPPDWTPGEGDEDAAAGSPTEGGEVPGAEVPGGGVPGADAALGDENLGADGMGSVDDVGDDNDQSLAGEEAPADETHFNPEAGAESGEPDEPADDDSGDAGSPEPETEPGATPAASDDVATDDEVGQMDDEDKEKYAAYDPAGRRGFLWSWRKHRHGKQHYSAGCGVPAMPKTAEPPAQAKEKYSRLESENKKLNERVETLERTGRHKERYSRLTELRRSHAFNIDDEFEDAKDLTPEQFDRHVNRIKRNYSRMPQEGGMPTIVTDDLDEVDGVTARNPEKMAKFSRQAKDLAMQSIRAGKHMSFDEALAKVMEGQATGAAAK